VLLPVYSQTGPRNAFPAVPSASPRLTRATCFSGGRFVEIRPVVALFTAVGQTLPPPSRPQEHLEQQPAFPQPPARATRNKP